MNLPQQLQEQLNYPALQVINANTGLPENEQAFDALSQSTLITFLSGLYKATRTKESAVAINSQVNGQELLSLIFKDEADVQNTIAAFAKQMIDVAKDKLEEVSNGFLVIMQQQNTNKAANEESYLQNLMSAQRSEILKYLPTGLKLGALLNDKSLEDNTNKMQGPVSTLMHKIENVFSKAD